LTFEQRRSRFGEDALYRRSKGGSAWRVNGELSRQQQEHSETTSMKPIELRHGNLLP
jgi:hypothetical protein